MRPNVNRCVGRASDRSAADTRHPTDDDRDKFSKYLEAVEELNSVVHRELRDAADSYNYKRRVWTQCSAAMVTNVRELIERAIKDFGHIMHCISLKSVDKDALKKPLWVTSESNPANPILQCQQLWRLRPFFCFKVPCSAFEK